MPGRPGLAKVIPLGGLRLRTCELRGRVITTCFYFDDLLFDSGRVPLPPTRLNLIMMETFKESVQSTPFVIGMLRYCLSCLSSLELNFFFTYLFPYLAHF